MGIANLTGKSEKSPGYLLNTKGNNGYKQPVYPISEPTLKNLRSNFTYFDLNNQSKYITSMILSTTSTLEGHHIENYLGIVSGETIIGANIFKDFFASITDIVGGRSSAYEQVLREAKATAMAEMEMQARQLGANAILGIDLDYETIREGMLMVTVSGTAVKVYKP